MILLETLDPAGRRVRTRRKLQPLDPARRALAEAAIGLAIHLANLAAARGRMPRDEAVGIALGGLTEAAARYEPGRIDFGGWAGMVIDHRLIVAGKAEARRAARFAQHADEGREAQVRDDRDPEPAQAVGTAEVVDRLRRALAPDTFALLWTAYAEEKPLANIARDRGLSRQRMSQLAAIAVRMARKVCPELAQL